MESSDTVVIDMADSHPTTDWVAQSAATTPDAVALVEDDGAETTYEELDRLADEAAAKLQGSGATRGDLTIVSVGGVGRPLIAHLWGAWRLGVPPVVMDRNSPLLAQWEHTLRRMWDAGLERETAVASRSHTVVLTSGSGGDPRPVRLTHGNVASAVHSSQLRLGNTGDDKWLLTLPLFHVGGLSVLWRSAAAGGTVVIHDKFDPARAAQAIKDGSASMASFVPTMLYRMLEADPGPYRGMRGLLLGGAAANRDLVERGIEAGLPILQTYGMTETASQIATVSPGAAVDALGTAGRPLADMEVTTGGAGVGEIIVSGPAVSPGYVGEPDRTEGHRTGDIGYLDDKGRLVVLGRSDDMVVTGGENVYPARVADVLSGHQFMDRIEVVAVPDSEWGRILVAVVVGDPASEDRIERWAQERLPRHEIPRRWVFVGELPLLRSGKVDRVALLEIASRSH